MAQEVVPSGRDHIVLSRIVRRSPSPATFISLLALFVSLGGTAYAATGGTFILGHANSATTASSLTSSVTTGPALSVTNTGGKPAAKFTANSGIAPFQVNSATKVTNLNADKLDGQDSTAFLGVGQKAADANLLDGVDSTAFARANVATGFIQTVQPGQAGDFVALGGMIQISYVCPETLTDSGLMWVENSSGDDITAFVDSGTDNPAYFTWLSGNLQFFWAFAAGDSWVIQAHGPAGILVVHVATVNRASDCYLQAQSVLTN
jgi:hypothetical protein